MDITEKANATEVYVGDEVTFTITVTNAGPGTATNANITDVLNDAFEYVSSSSGGSYDNSTRTVTWNIGNIEPGVPVEVTVVVNVLTNGTYNNTAVVVCEENKTQTNDTTDITSKKSALIISVGNYTTTPDTDVLVEITVVDERGAKVTIDLTVEVTGPESTDSLPAHNSLGADTRTVNIIDGKGNFTYHVPADATDGTSYVVTATSEETEEYKASEGTGYIDVVQYKTTTTISDASGAPGEEVTLTVEVTAEDDTPVNGEVVVTDPNGEKITVTITDGKGEFKWIIPEDAENSTEYQFTASFKGNNTYLSSNGTGVVTTVTKDEPEDDPEEEPEDEPEEPEKDSEVPAKETPVVKMLNTSNPLVVLLVAFVLMGLGLKRREEE